MRMLIEPCVRRRFSVEEYFKLGELGFFGPEERLELIEGEILIVPAPGPEHDSRVMRFDAFLQRRLQGLALVMIDGTTIVSTDSAPEPDVAILRHRDDFYESANPRPDDILAIVEIAYSSLRFDRGPKLELYARCGIREYWIVDVAARTIERHRHPDGGGYADRRIFRNGESIAFEAFPEHVFQVDDLVGPPPSTANQQVR